MLSPGSDQVRVFLHVLGASVWVGGQIVLATLVPVLRRVAPEAVPAVARRFQLVAWPAFALLLATGVWNLAALGVADQPTEWIGTLVLKLALVAVSGVGAAAHALLTGPMVSAASDAASRRRRRALSGATAALGLVAALGAAFVGTML
jgi:putative copper export protein